MDYSIEVNESDVSLLPITNIGAYTTHEGSKSELKILGTASKEAFSNWCKVLDENKCHYTIVSGA